jgi:hypothetical protein
MHGFGFFLHPDKTYFFPIKALKLIAIVLTAVQHNDDFVLRVNLIEEKRYELLQVGILVMRCYDEADTGIILAFPGAIVPEFKAPPGVIEEMK